MGCINLDEYTKTVLGFISKCIDEMTVTKTVKLHSTDTPWFTSKVCSYTGAGHIIRISSKS